MGLTHVPPQDLAPRLTGLALSSIPVPTGTEEEWRFTPLERLGGLERAVSATGFADWKIDVPAEVAVESLPTDIAGFVSADRISVAAITNAQYAIAITVPAGAELPEPLVLALHGAVDALTYSHVTINVGDHATCTIVIDFTGSGTHATTVELVTGNGAHATLVHVADGERDQVLAGQQHLRIGRDATVDHVAITLGGDLVREVTTVAYEGPGGSVDALGVYFTDAGQHHEHRLFVDHAVPHCRSNVVYKGALQGDDAHAVWVGDVFIRAAGTQIETYEINRNLVLTDGARVDSVPNLEIETGNVTSAGHASTTGRFDEDQLFYLTSRGIPEIEAKRLVVRGFIRDVVARIPGDALRDRLERRVEQRLGVHDARFDFADGDE